MLERLLKVKGLEAIRREAAADQPNALKRSLKIKDLVAIGVGFVIGSGIFVTAGLAAAGSGDYPAAGPAVTVSFIIVALACLLCVLCYAEFASYIPSAGSAYTYAYASLGEFTAWILGWNLILEYMVGNIAVAISWSGYFASICRGFGLDIPTWLLHSYFGADPQVIASAPQILGVPIVFNLPAVLIVLLICAMVIRGMRESANVNDALVVLKILIILGVIGLGACYVNPQNWIPFAPNGLAGIQAGAAIVFFAYIGFDAITTVAEETENPKRDLPLGMIITLVISTTLYVATSAVLTGMVPYSQLGTSDPMATAFELLNMPMVAAFISIGAVISMTAVLIIFQIAQPRIFFAMARDGLLPKSLSKVHPVYRTPYITTLGMAAFVTLGAGFMDLSVVIELCNIGTLFAFAAVCLGVIVMRRTRPEIEPAFRTPWVPWVPLGGILCCFYLVAGMPPITWLRFVVWVILGVVIYFAYGYRHSRLLHGGQVEAATESAVAPIEAETEREAEPESKESKASE